MFDAAPANPWRAIEANAARVLMLLDATISEMEALIGATHRATPGTYQPDHSTACVVSLRLSSALHDIRYSARKSVAEARKDIRAMINRPEDAL
jgi:hypothetical protein